MKIILYMKYIAEYGLKKHFPSRSQVIFCENIKFKMGKKKIMVVFFPVSDQNIVSPS